MLVLDKGYVTLLNVAGPSGLGDDIDPAKAARISFNNEDKVRTKEQDLKLITYLWNNKHTTPFEMIETWWEMKLPIFVARQLVRHRTVSINEVSRRYVTDEIEYYIPEIWRKASSNKKQGSEGEVSYINSLSATNAIVSITQNSTIEYDNLIRLGVCPEQARIILPLCTYTRWLWKQDLHNLIHMLKLRTHEHAQWETRQYAVAMTELLREKLPSLMNIVMPKEEN